MLSDENDFFKRELQIDSEATFLELNDFILDSLGYARDELTTFHICDEEWQKELEITMMDMGASSDEDSYLMATRVWKICWIIRDSTSSLSSIC